MSGIRVSRDEVTECIGRLEKSLNCSTVTVCADCQHSSLSPKRKKSVCLARPHYRDLINGDWYYAKCHVANNGDCELFAPKESQIEIPIEKDAEQQSSQQEPEQVPKSWWRRFV